jgi:hypothetical protein
VIGRFPRVGCGNPGPSSDILSYRRLLQSPPRGCRTLLPLSGKRIYGDEASEARCRVG